MRLRTFTAKTMPEAMALVRQQLGSEAIILSTGRASGGISVTAALEPADLPVHAENDDGEPPLDPIDAVHEALVAHGTPTRIVESVITAALEFATPNPVLTLAGGFDAIFSFAPLTDRRPGRPVMLVGPPGAGKTVSIAKLATRAVLAGHRPLVISTDTVRAGGMAQLEAYTHLLGVALHRAEGDRQLAQLANNAGDDVIVLIDSAGINPYSAGDRGELASYLAATDAEPVLVLPAGGDVYDAIEIAQVFAALGSTRLLTTRLDMVHRLGSVLAAADAARLSFCDAGVTPDVAKGLIPLNPVALARLLIPEAVPARAPTTPEHPRS